MIATMESDATTVGGDGTAGMATSVSALSFQMSNFLISAPAASLTTVGVRATARMKEETWKLVNANVERVCVTGLFLWATKAGQNPNESLASSIVYSRGLAGLTIRVVTMTDHLRGPAIEPEEALASILMLVTRIPLASSKAPIAAAERPFPREDRTPPVTKMNFLRMCGPVDENPPQEARGNKKNGERVASECCRGEAGKADAPFPDLFSHSLLRSHDFRDTGQVCGRIDRWAAFGHGHNENRCAIFQKSKLFQPL